MSETMNCPGFQRLIDFLDDRLDDADAVRMAAHLLTNCDACNESRNWYLQVKSIAASDDSIAPQSWVLKRAVHIFETARGAAAGGALWPSYRIAGF
jgi:hypothetical protein